MLEVTPHKAIQVLRVTPSQGTLWAECLALQLCKEDREEIEVSTGLPWKEALKESLELSSEVYVGTFLGKVECVFGLHQDLSQPYNVPWFLSTGKIQETYSFFFLKEARKIVKEWGGRGKSMYNMVREDRKQWLKFLGFTFGRTYKFVHSFTGKPLNLTVFTKGANINV